MSTYSQLYIQIVFAVKYRQKLIRPGIREEVHKYITGIIKKEGHKLYAIYCMPDHCHIFVSMHPKQSISDLVRIVKANSSKWINKSGLVKEQFRWQEGFGAFSYSILRKKQIIRYILKQESHHKFITSSTEYQALLEEFEIGCQN